MIPASGTTVLTCPKCGNAAFTLVNFTLHDTEENVPDPSRLLSAMKQATNRVACGLGHTQIFHAKPIRFELVAKSGSPRSKLHCCICEFPGVIVPAGYEAITLVPDVPQVRGVFPNGVHDIESDEARKAAILAWSQAELAKQQKKSE